MRRSGAWPVSVPWPPLALRSCWCWYWPLPPGSCQFCHCSAPCRAWYRSDSDCPGPISFPVRNCCHCSREMPGLLSEVQACAAPGPVTLNGGFAPLFLSGASLPLFVLAFLTRFQGSNHALGFGFFRAGVFQSPGCDSGFVVARRCGHGRDLHVHHSVEAF